VEYRKFDLTEDENRMVVARAGRVGEREVLREVDQWVMSYS
jgi:hypothetical protein